MLSRARSGQVPDSYGKRWKGKGKGRHKGKAEGAEENPAPRVRSQKAIERRILKGFAKRAERALSTGDEEAAVGRVPQEAPEASALSTERLAASVAAGGGSPPRLGRVARGGHLGARWSTYPG